ncbi:zinc finger protein 436-like [Thunnus albacares]|uniref:zinc finger protein 436-like n=1 Tax=Thunnus albacares TaxID=8236 RepID=UPI001CF6DAA5|nr:zinc finger protein 436-like [Thunnus albacares]
METISTSVKPATQSSVKMPITCRILLNSIKTETMEEYEAEEKTNSSKMSSSAEKQTSKNLAGPHDEGEESFIGGQMDPHQRADTVEKTRRCDQCQKSFSSSAYLKYHQRIHTGEKPYTCDQCGRSFTASGNLKNHQRTHTGEKPYTCDQCGRSFTQSGNLKNHQRTHTGEKPYTCDQLW